MGKADAKACGGAQAVEQGGWRRDRGIDALRGLVMILMALDHTRDFLGASGINPRSSTEPWLFMTRWITHFCAPVFVFLAGFSAWYSLQKHGRPQLAARQLQLRGLWLVVLELSLVRWGWTFAVGFQIVLLQALWVMGWGMLALSLLIRWPRQLVVAFGLLLIASHNLLDPIHAASFGSAAWIWALLHEPQWLVVGSSFKVWILYPLIPWVGVIAIGFGWAPVLASKAHNSRFFFAWSGVLLAVFVVLRGTGLYGDPHPWAVQPTLLASLLGFVNCEKYPPSLLFLLMTLAMMLAAYPLLNRLRGGCGKILVTFGQVPLFFYLLHVPLIHVVAVLLAAARQQPLGWLFGGFPILQKPAGYGMPLLAIYGAWLLILALLYPACDWYCRQKRYRRQWWHWLV